MRLGIVEIKLRAAIKAVRHISLRINVLRGLTAILSQNDRCSIYTLFAATVNRRYGRDGSSQRPNVQVDCHYR